MENGLLTGIRKLAWPKLKQHYGERLEQLYADLAEGQANELSELRRSGADAPVLQTVSRAAAALLGAATTDLSPDAHFTDLGGDSLSALTFGNLLHEIFDIDVPVGVIVSPANDLAAIADYIEGERQGTKRPTFASVHGRDGGRGARQRPHAGQVHRRIDAGCRANAAAAQRRGAHRAVDRRDRLPGPLPRPGMAGADGPGRRQSDRPGARQVRRGRAGPAGQDLRQRRPETAGALPGAGRRPPGGHRRRQGRGQPRPGRRRPGSGWPTRST